MTSLDEDLPVMLPGALARQVPLLTSGGDAAQLVTRLEAAQRELAAMMLTREVP